MYLWQATCSLLIKPVYFSVKPAIFDLILTVGIIAYIEVVYLSIVYFPNIYTQVCKLSVEGGGKYKMQ